MNPEMTSNIVLQCKEELERHARAEYPQGFPKLPPLPAARYSDPEFFELEKKYVFAKSWLFAGTTDEVAKSGDYKLWERLGDSIIIVRGKDNQIRAFYNTCRHRGASVVDGSSGKSSVLTCRYHGWVYDLDGTLKGIPDGHDFKDLVKSEHNLLSLRCESWGNLIFINKDANARPLMESLGPIAKDFEENFLDTRHVYHVMNFEMQCNWKVAADAFNETYHVAQTHPNTVFPYLDHMASHAILYPNGSSAMYTLKKHIGAGADPFAIPADFLEKNPGFAIHNRANPQYMIFPNMQSSTGVFQYAYLLYWPNSVNSTTVQVVCTAPEGYDDPASTGCQQLVYGYEVSFPEDLENFNCIQKSMESNPDIGLLISYSERRLYHFAEAIDRCIGVENIPEHLRIPHVLDPYHEDPYEETA